MNLTNESEAYLQCTIAHQGFEVIYSAVIIYSDHIPEFDIFEIFDNRIECDNKIAIIK